MKLSELRRAYYDIPEDCHAALVHTARRVSGTPEVPRHLPLHRVLVIATLALLALCTIAYAAGRMGILSYLLGERTPNLALRESAQQLDAYAEADDISLRVHGVLYDGERLALSWTAENLRPEAPAMLQISSVTMGGKPISIDFTSMGQQWLPSVYGVQEQGWSGNPLEGGLLSGPMREPLTGPQEVTIQLVVNRPTGPLVVVDEFLLEDLENIEDKSYRSERQAMLEGLIQSGIQIADTAHLDPDWWYRQGYTVVESGGTVYDPYEAASFVRGGQYNRVFETQMEETAHFTLSFFIDAEAGMAHRRQYTFQPDGLETLLLADCRAELENFVVTPLSTRLHYRLYPMENTEEKARMLLGKYGWVALADEYGNPIVFADMEYMLNSPQCRQDGEGNWMAEWDLVLPGMEVFPEEVHLRTGIEGEGDSVADIAFRLQ